MSVAQIAQKAGVSPATVSRVLNNSRPVNPKIAELVLRAMQDLKFSPNQIRRRPRNRAARELSLAIVSLGQDYRGWLDRPVMAGMVAELTRAAQEQQVGIMMAEMPDPNQLSPVLRRHEVDGALVFFSGTMEAGKIETLRRHIPVVRVLGGQIGPVDVDNVGVDNNSVGHLAGTHLLSQRCDQYAFVTFQPRWSISKVRSQGFAAAMATAGVASRSYVAGAIEHDAGFYGINPVVGPDEAAVVRALAKHHKGRTGLFVSRDEEAVQVYRLLTDAGLRPGRDVVVISCDNEAVRLSTLHPRPASIDLNVAQVARHAVRRLIGRIQLPDEPPVRVLVNPRLVEGDSVTASAPTERR